MGKHDNKSSRAASIIKYCVLFVLVCALVVFALTAAGDGTLSAFHPLDQPDIESPSLEATESTSPPPSVTPSSPGPPDSSPSPNAPVMSIDVPEVLSPPLQLLSAEEINGLYAEYGKITIPGMKPEDYDNAMAIQWRVLETPGEPEDLSVDLLELMDYSAYERYILNLDKYAGVEVSVIGESEQGRNIYMVTLDFGKPADKDKPVIMLTGGVHAREFAGTEYIIKIFNDTIKKAQNDPYTMALLESATVVAVPLVNPDGREMIIKSKRSGRKSNANGVDLNRAMPSANAGQLADGYKRNKRFSKKPSLAYFGGYNLGTESETQAMIKWFNTFVPTASLYVDLHQQGAITYYNKSFLSSELDAASEEYAKINNEMLNRGYRLKLEPKPYGLDGAGGTFTDYARSVADGLTYSYSLGRMVLLIDGVETPLMVFKDIDLVKQHYKPLNPGFRSICIEIGRYAVNRGWTKTARKYRKKEFERYGWEDFLTGTINNVIGKEAALLPPPAQSE